MAKSNTADCNGGKLLSLPTDMADNACDDDAANDALAGEFVPPVDVAGCGCCWTTTVVAEAAVAAGLGDVDDDDDDMNQLRRYGSRLVVD